MKLLHITKLKREWYLMIQKWMDGYIFDKGDKSALHQYQHVTKRQLRQGGHSYLNSILNQVLGIGIKKICLFLLFNLATLLRGALLVDALL